MECIYLAYLPLMALPVVLFMDEMDEIPKPRLFMFAFRDMDREKIALAAD